MAKERYCLMRTSGRRLPRSARSAQSGSSAASPPLRPRALAAPTASHSLVQPAQPLIRNHRRLGPGVVVINADLKGLSDALDRVYPPRVEAEGR